MADLEIGSVFAGHRIDGRAGKGGMGVVYRATDLQLDRPVALKVVSPEFASDPPFAERFKRESRLAASLDHPNVIPIYHAGEEDGRLYVTMRFVEGTDLAEVLKRDRRLDPERAVGITMQIGAALDAAHARGLVHRDVKPANILMQDDHVFLTDFGLSKHVGSGDDLTETGAVLGTVDYMAPEQVQGGIVDGRSDVYALGCVLFQMLSGRVPFERPSGMAKLFAHVSEPAPRVKDVPEPLADVVARAMEKEPGRRYQSAGELALAAADAIGVSAAGPAPPPIRVQRPGRRSRRAWLAGGLALIAAAVAAVVVLVALGGGSTSSGQSARAAVVALIRHVHDGFDVRFCRDGITQSGLETYFAPRKGTAALNTCINQGDPKRSHNPDPLVTRNLTIQGSSASVDLKSQGQFLTFYLVKEGGRWKVNDVDETPKIRYERALTTAFTPDYEAPKGYNEFLAGSLSYEATDGLAARVAREIPRIVAALRAIHPPAGFADVHSEVVAALLAIVDGVRQARDAEQAGDRAAFKRADRQLIKATK